MISVGLPPKTTHYLAQGSGLVSSSEYLTSECDRQARNGSGDKSGDQAAPPHPPSDLPTDQGLRPLSAE
jgi:hypothetical protein